MRLLKRAKVVYREGGLGAFLTRGWSFFKRSILGAYLLKPLIRLFRRIATQFVSTEPGLVLFGFKDELKGNSGIVYEWLVENEPGDLTPVWMTSSKSTAKSLTEQGYPVAYTRSVRGQLIILTAAVACYDSMSNNTLPDRVTSIKVRHEVPVKDGPKAARRAATRTDIPEHDYVITTSKFLAEKQLAYHRGRKGGEEVRLEQFVALGYPRNDMLFDIPPALQERWDDFVGELDPERIILYAPTRRRQDEYKTSNTDFFPFEDFSMAALESALEEHDALLLVRPHPGDAKRIWSDEFAYETIHEQQRLAGFLDELCSLERVRDAGTDEFGDTNELLQFTDLLITDYSTVYHTFLLLDRPMVFFPYDYEQFEESFGFKYDYREQLPGPEIHSFEGFMDYLDRIAAGEDPHQEKRTALREKLHDHPDGHATQRLVEFIRECAQLSSR